MEEAKTTFYIHLVPPRVVQRDLASVLSDDAIPKIATTKLSAQALMAGKKNMGSDI